MTGAALMSRRAAAAVLASAALVHSACRREPAASPSPSSRTAAEYFEQVIRGLAGCFDWRGDEDLEATVRFVVVRDGTVSEAELVEESGNTGFDQAALDAVACLRSSGGVGPLPAEVPGGELPIQFSFRPMGRD